eukprot:CAMPEP_0171963930 /NCGR_PEP_ID=MMETSP0993-20121228/178653_1 /TAXON_ID=483369 /ORGANISM="non described non described, Strain CCMP2098" /LENGTH=74 /DNA_ID=CAMNT_0012612655 /DNA_START=39 /DNA_END=260 /DNA_ORIENTATION=+
MPLKASNYDDAGSNEAQVYSQPELYDLAFSYRNFDGEVAFLKAAHAKHNAFRDLAGAGAGAGAGASGNPLQEPQ